MNLVRKLNEQPVSIESSGRKLTDGQIALLALMKQKIEDGETITKAEIKDIYNTHVRTTEGGRWWSDTNNDWVYWEHSDYEVNLKSQQWFRLNLGSLILKAKLVVIPLIEIE